MTLAVAGSGAAPASGAAPDEHRAMLEKYCVSCHNATDWAGGVAFDTLELDAVASDAAVWENTIRKLRGALMPPPGKEHPGTQQVKAMVTWLEGTLDASAAAHPDPGRVGLHRLNRREYANAIRDLLGLDVNPEALLPRDDAHDGFDNIASALQVSPSFLDQYIAAAQTVAQQALGNTGARPAATNYFVSDAGTQQRHRDGLPFGTRGGTVVEHVFPADGEYSLTIANMASALWVLNLEHENTLVALLDGKEFWRTTIGGGEDVKSIDQKQDPAVDAINRRLKDIRFHATAGLRKVTVTFLDRGFAETDSRLHTIAPGGGQDRIQRLTSFEVRGPHVVAGLSDSESRKRVFSCQPEANASEATQRACARSIVERLGRAAFRRPLLAQDTDALMKLYDSGRTNGGFEGGVKRALTGILASPQFLFRADLSLKTAAAGEVRSLSDLELASRLSFFLWSSLPDDELLTVAAQNKLHEPAVLEAQVRRLLADPRSIALTDNFAFQWLNVGKLSEIDPDPRLFPYAAGGADPRKDFREELRLFIDAQFRGDHSVLDLLTSDRTFLNERLALHYGMTGVRGDRFREVQFTQDARRGLLGKGALLMLTSYPTRTAPVLRGAWVLERLMGTPPSPPPPQVESLKENHPGDKPKTIRELTEIHRANPQCNSCHGVMDPLGFALENFDAVGQFRTVDRDVRSAIDSSGTLPDGRPV
ncbi:MAG: DUF1592 domain-containing protein, partial [Steroidobacteraceae bacterium]